MNVDYETCWLNSCLQLVLTAIDHITSPLLFNSELGEELMRLKSSEQDILDPATAKTIIVGAEDTRIALRISELETEIEDEVQLEHQIRAVRRLRSTSWTTVHKGLLSLHARKYGKLARCLLYFQFRDKQFNNLLWMQSSF